MPSQDQIIEALQTVVAGKREYIEALRADIRAAEKVIDVMEGELAALGVSRQAMAKHPDLPRPVPVDEVPTPKMAPELRESFCALRLPQQVNWVLRERGKPMSVAEITQRLVELGVTTKAQRGLAPMVSSTLTRRRDDNEPDYFVRLKRGTYALAEWNLPEAEADDPVPTERNLLGSTEDETEQEMMHAQDSHG